MKAAIVPKAEEAKVIGKKPVDDYYPYEEIQQLEDDFKEQEEFDAGEAIKLAQNIECMQDLVEEVDIAEDGE